MIFKKKHLSLPDKEELHSMMQLKQKDKQLLQMMFASHVTPEEKTAFFKDLDIEKEPMEFNLMLAHLCHRHGSQGIPTVIIPRIRGVARFYVFKNAALFSSFEHLGKIFNKAGIPMLLLKGAAIKANYNPNACRCLGDIDFAVPKERLNEAVKIAESQGFQIISDALHSIDMKQSEINGTAGSIDIHHCLFKTSNRRSIEDELADGASSIRFFGAEVWIPSAENLLLQLLENEFHDLCIVRNNRRRFKWIYDSGLVLSSSLQFDWIHLINTAKKYSIYEAIQPMLSLLADYLPLYVPKNMPVNNFPLEHPQQIREMEKVVMIHLDWCLQGIRRDKLRSCGKKWRSLFLWPSQMTAKYRMFRYNGKVHNPWEFILLHCQAKNFCEVLFWLLAKLRTWNYKENKRNKTND